jgi:hypothetical protein
MTTELRLTDDRSDCVRFDAQLGAWLERDLDATADAWMAHHRASCATCDAVVRDLEALVAEAAALPPVAPPRDLWAGIEARLEAPVIPLHTATGVATRPRRTVSVRWFAVAATLLVAVSSGVTWQFARGRAITAGTVMATPPAAGDPLVTTETLPDAATEFAIATPVSQPAATPAATAAGARTRLAAREDDDADLADPNVTYEREIAALRLIVDERFTELDSSTVTELRRNLDIIDRAIGDSRAALARDPRSGVVSSQLDRALQAKLTLLRRVALL